MQKELTILMPCLNEEKTIKICIDKAFRFLNENNIDGEVLIADNGSTDNTLTIIKSTDARVINVIKRGYGCALINRIKNSNGEYIIMCDSDDSYDMDNLMPFLKKLQEGYDLVIGNRYKGGLEKDAMSTSHFIGVEFLTHFSNIIHGTNIGDYHCGLRAFNRKKLMKLNLQSSGMEFASEMIIRAKQSNYTIIEIPTKLFKDGRECEGHLNTIRDGFRHLFLIIKCIKK